MLKYLDGAKADTAAIQIERLTSILELYKLDMGQYPSNGDGLAALITAPSSSNGWNGPYIKKESSLIDPWGTAYHYKFPGSAGDFDLFSYGADKSEGGDEAGKDIGK